MDSIDRRSAWRGEELFRRGWRHEWSEAHRQEIEAALRASLRRSLDELSPSTFPLESLADELRAIEGELEQGPGAVMIRGLRVDDHSEDDLRRIFQGLMSWVGTPVSQSARGEKLLEVKDERHGAASPSTRGPNTNRSLSFHTDRCDVIAFLCVRDAHSGGENDLVSSVALFEEIERRRPDLLAVLQQPFVYERHNVDTGSELPFTRQPVFSIHEGRFAAVLLRVLIDRADQNPNLPSLSDAQREALDFLEAVAAEPGMHVRFRLEPGDMLLLNNYVILHRRTAFEDHLEVERQRLLFRLWLSVPSSRPLDPAYGAYLGATGPGELRGGMKARE
ncbi:MAG: TauD/TfdA family dioxygenase [Planctomycetota bacterium]